MPFCEECGAEVGDDRQFCDVFKALFERGFDLIRLS